MKTKQKLLSMLVALVMVLGVFAPVFAVEVPTGSINPNDLTNDRPDSTELIIHKLQADSYNEGAPWDHTGGAIADLDSLGTNVRELDGVTFTYYKVTAQELKTMVANPSTYDTTEKVGGNPAGTITTADGAGATLNLEEGYYWFVESDKPATVSSAIAVPFGISLPLASNGKYLSTVHVYPKNVTGDEPEPDKTVNDLTNKYSSHNIGDVQSWYLQATIPGNIKDYGMLKMTDTFSDSLTYKGNVVVKYGAGDTFEGLNITLEEGTDYTISQPEVDTKGGELVIDLTKTGIAKLAANYVEGGKLVAKVDTVINEDAIMGLDIPNGYTLSFNNNPNNTGDPTEKPVPEDKQPKVVTGGKRFKKVDGETPLANAIFQLLDENEAVNWTEELITANQAAINAGKFATESNGEYTATSEANQPQAGQPIYLRSVDDGTFEIKGLELSEWQPLKWDAASNSMVENGAKVTHDWNLKEVQAPDGYAILKDAEKFVIDKNSYFNEPTEVNQTPADPQLIQNNKLTIPQTGGMGTVLFVLVGLGLMAGALIAMKKRNESEQF